ncbi:MAG: MFS transporter [Pseudomonadota bacterium]
MLAAALLTVMSFHGLFAGTVVGFLFSAALVMSVRLPQSQAVSRAGGIYAKTFRGMSIYLRTPRLRGLLALNLAAAAASSMVIVNTVVYVQSKLARPSTDVPITLAAFGFGSMLVALLLPRLLEKRPDRPAMLIGASIMALGLLAGVGVANLGGTFEWPALLLTWFGLGIGYSMTQTPGGRLLKRSAASADRPALFAAQFSLSHACWLITYPLAGQLGARFGMAVTFGAMAALTLLGLAIAWRAWPVADEDELAHEHRGDEPGLADHLKEGHSLDGQRHRHNFNIDELHDRWPRSH